MTSVKLFEKLVGLINNCHKSNENNDGAAVTVRQANGKLAFHELKCEAIEIIFQHLLQNEFPLWFALHFSSKVLKEHLYDILTSEYATDQCIEENCKSDNDTNESTVDLHSFSNSVVSTFHSTCKQYYSTSTSVPDLPPCPLLYNTSVFAIKNSRRKMEDRHVIVPNLGLLYPSNDILTNSAFFAVFDGHGGQECSNYAAIHLLNAIIKELLTTNLTNCLAALHGGFKCCEKFLLRKCQRENLRSGTTSVCTLIVDNNMYIAWTGDSQAVLLESSGGCKYLTPCHDTKNEAECARVINQGGLMMNVRGENRVNGVINVTRSLGDSYLKPPLSSEPEIISVPLTGNEDCLILGCDGLWEGVTLNRCSEIMRTFVKTNSTGQYCDLAKLLVNEAKSNDVADNITALVVFLKPLDNLKQCYSN